MDADVAFLAVPHTAGMQYVRGLLDRGMKVVEKPALSSAARYRSRASFRYPGATMAS
jgi:N-acetyl-gamma-glutamylphosphate reductase